MFLISLILAIPAWADTFVFPKASGGAYVETDLLELYKKETKGLTGAKRAAALEKLNAKTIKSMKSDAPFISQERAQKIHDSISSHPIVGIEGARKYDDLSQHIGYCFGAAAYVHVEALRKGAQLKSVGKVFALGKLKYRGATWEFHVATVVKSKDSWWAIDGYGNKVLELQDWMNQVNKWSDEPVRFYFTDAAKFLPIKGEYSKENMYGPWYRGYFSDLNEWFLKRGAPGA